MNVKNNQVLIIVKHGDFECRKPTSFVDEYYFDNLDKAWEFVEVILIPHYRYISKTHVRFWGTKLERIIWPVVRGKNKKCVPIKKYKDKTSIDWNYYDEHNLVNNILKFHNDFTHCRYWQDKIYCMELENVKTNQCLSLMEFATMYDLKRPYIHMRDTIKELYMNWGDKDMDNEAMNGEAIP